MKWVPWSRNDPQGLARYVTKEAKQCLALGVNRFDAGDQRRVIIEAIYNALVAKKIQYNIEDYHPAERLQHIRTPAEILGAPHEGTCLDLAALFCGLCLANELLPMLIMIEGHALAAVSLTHGLRDWDNRPEFYQFEEGPLTGPALLRQLIDDGVYLAIECTGFAHSEKLGQSANNPPPETIGRTNGVLSFGRAATAGREQLDGARKFCFALDIALAQYHWRIEPYPVDLPTWEPPFMAPPPTVKRMFGRGKYLEKLKQRLLNSTGRTVTLLMQFPGVGKSELAAFLANDEDIKKHYSDGVLWAPLGKKPNEEALLSEWAQELKIPPEEMNLAGTIPARIGTINRYIRNKRMLLIVDDAWKVRRKPEEPIVHRDDDDAWIHFREIGARCDLIVTTRSIEVAVDFVTGPVTEENGIFQLKALSEKHGLALLEFLAPNAMKSQKEKELGRELVRAVESLPLALVLMGRYLVRESFSAGPKRIKEALQKLQDAKQRLVLEMSRLPRRPEDQPRTLMAAIDMSVKELDDEARQALYMLAVIRPKPYPFSNKDVEGMFGIENESLRKLADAGLLEVVKPDDGEPPGGSAAADQEDRMEEEEEEEEAPEYYRLPRTIADYAQAQITDKQLEEYQKKAANYFASLLREYEEERTGDATSYQRMYSYERPDWQRVKAAWLYHQAQTSNRTEANLNMAQTYFDAFWWWRCYNKEFPFCDQLLKEWRETQTNDVDREWLAQLTKFQEAYPTGYEKQDKGDWRAVEESLLEIRRLGGMDWNPGALPPRTPSSCDKTAGRLHVRAITNFFLAESYRYRAVNDQRVDKLYDESVRIFREHRAYPEDDDWNLPWAYWHLADLALERSQGEKALEMAAESLRLVRETSEEIFDEARDNEVISNDYRVRGDVYWQQRELELAFQNYALAVFYAYLFQYLPKCPDFYTADFYAEMTTRTRNRLAELWADGQKDAALQACAYLCEFWEPYWELQQSSSTKVDYQALLEAGELVTLELVLFPPRPAEHDRREDSKYVHQVRKVTEAMRDQVEEIGNQGSGGSAYEFSSAQARAQQVNQIVRAM